MVYRVNLSIAYTRGVKENVGRGIKTVAVKVAVASS